MKLRNVTKKPHLEATCNLATAFQKVQVLIESLNQHNLPEEIITTINSEIDALNAFEGTEKELVWTFGRTEKKIIQLVSSKLGLVPEKYYTNRWLPLGMTVFGLPFGMLVFLLTGNAAFIGIGLPLGMSIGIFLGMALDKKAAKQYKVLKMS